jgi:hypothetical protein
MCVSQPYCRMHAALHCLNMCHAFYLAMQHHLDCVHPSGKHADSRSTYINNVLHMLFVATINAVCLMLSRDVCLQVLSWHSSVLEDARHVPSDFAIKSLLVWAYPISSHRACCLPDTVPVCVSSSPVLTQQTGRCAKRPCLQVSPCSSSQQVDNPTLCNYAVKNYFKTAASNCLKKSPTKNPLVVGLHAAT